MHQDLRVLIALAGGPNEEIFSKRRPRMQRPAKNGPVSLQVCFRAEECPASWLLARGGFAERAAAAMLTATELDEGLRSMEEVMVDCMAGLPRLIRGALALVEMVALFIVSDPTESNKYMAKDNFGDIMEACCEKTAWARLTWLISMLQPGHVQCLFYALDGHCAPT